jgi:hypothetical protein
VTTIEINNKIHLIKQNTGGYHSRLHFVTELTHDPVSIDYWSLN